MSTPVPLAWHRLPAASLGLVLHTTRRGRAEFLKASQVMAQNPEVTCLLDGSMFESPNIIRYTYVDTAAGINEPGQASAAGRGATLSVVGGVASTARGRVVAPGADVAIQVPFTMVEGGRSVWPAGAEPSQVWRAGLGLLDSGDLVFVVGHGGIPSWTARALSADYGGGARLEWLGYTDGGHSAILWERGGRRMGYPGEDPQIFGFLVQRDGPATPMPGPSGAADPLSSRASSSSSSSSVVIQATGGESEGWGYVVAVGLAAAVVGVELVRHRR